jgi:hypothetical protein
VSPERGWEFRERSWERSTRPPRRIGEALSEVAADLNLDNPDDVAAVMAAWSEAVGEAVAGGCASPAGAEGPTRSREVDQAGGTQGVIS